MLPPSIMFRNVPSWLRIVQNYVSHVLFLGSLLRKHFRRCFHRIHTRVWKPPGKSTRCRPRRPTPAESWTGAAPTSSPDCSSTTHWKQEVNEDGVGCLSLRATESQVRCYSLLGMRAGRTKPAMSAYSTGICQVSTVTSQVIGKWNNALTDFLCHGSSRFASHYYRMNSTCWRRQHLQGA